MENGGKMKNCERYDFGSIQTFQCGKKQRDETKLVLKVDKALFEQFKFVLTKNYSSMREFLEIKMKEEVEK